MGGGERGVSVPLQWQNSGGGSSLDVAALGKWWERFRDPALNVLIAEGRRNSPDIRTAVSRIAESRARGGVERAGLLPTVSGGASGRASRTETRATNLVTTGESWNATMDAGWQVDLFGKQWQNVRAARADLAQSVENYHAALVSLSADIAEAYVNLRSAEAQLAVVENTLKAREETLQITQWREQAGVGTGLDTLQSTSTLEQARAAIPSLQQTIAQTRNQLTLLTGNAPGALDSLLRKSRPVPAVPTRIAIGIPAKILRQRPDIRAAERGLEAEMIRTKSAKLERLPSFNLSGSIGVDALKAGKLFSPESVASSVLGNLSAPIFDAGRIRENINIQVERERQAAIAYEAAVLQALSEVENALIATQRTAERLRILDRALLSAREAEKIASQQYQAGQADLLTVLEAQRTLLSLEEQSVIASANQVNAHIQLYKTLGGGWN